MVGVSYDALVTTTDTTKEHTMTMTTTKSAAGNLHLGDRVIVSKRLACYLGRQHIEGLTLPVVGLAPYGATTIGVTLKGLPEVGCAADGLLDVETNMAHVLYSETIGAMLATMPAADARRTPHSVWVTFGAIAASIAERGTA